MKVSILGAAISLLSSSTLVAAQTFSDCNPLSKTCPPKPAFGKSATFDFTKGASDDFKATGTPSYDSNGVGFSVAKQGDAPLLQSNWYIMFGRVDCVIKAAPGKGIVSSAVLQSDDLDEIDWEWLGANDAYVQTNYFGKGETGSFNRGATHDDQGNHDDFHTYTIEWTSDQIVWQIDGKTVRVLTPETADSNQYPQSPMMVRVGVWAGGDPNNAPGTIQWSGGLTDYGAGPYTMYMKSISVTDYSTGTAYSYGDKSGSWQSIKSEGGSINGNSAAEPKSTESAPAVTATIDVPVPFSGTHKETSSFVTPDVWPWVPTATAGSTEATKGSFPSGWSASGSGQVRPPSAASSTARSTSALFVSAPASSSPSGIKTGSASVVSSGPHTNAHTNAHTKTSTSTDDSTESVATTLATETSATSSATETQHVAPNVGAANSMFIAPGAMTALCVVFVSGFAFL